MNSANATLLLIGSDVTSKSLDEAPFTSNSIQYKPSDLSQGVHSEGCVNPVETDGLGSMGDLEEEREIPSEWHLASSELASGQQKCLAEVMFQRSVWHCCF